MFDFRIYKVCDKEWDDYISKSHFYDFYHTTCYHNIDEFSKGEALLLIATSSDQFIGLPVILRTIEGTNYYDATSVYGYPGPIASSLISDLSYELVMYFQENIKVFCRNYRVVSIFSRLSPFFETSPLFNHLGEVRSLTKVVAIDLNQSPHKQRANFSSSNKNEINRLRKLGFTFNILGNNQKKDILSFIDIYEENMRLLGANKKYFFSYDYFFNFLNNRCFKTYLLSINYGDIICCAAIFSVTSDIMQYHLSGTRNEYRKYKPMKLLIDEARLLGNELGLKWINLGGGHSNTENDTLFQFKSSFSNTFMDFKVWCYIADHNAYSDLVSKHNLNEVSGNNYFPLYRFSQ